MTRRWSLLFGAVGAVAVLGLAAHRIWIHNPHEDELFWEVETVFDEHRETLVIRNATLIDVERGRALPGAQLAIEGEKIAALRIGEEIEAPPDAGILDADGRYVIPGLFDVHVHLAMHPHLMSEELTERDALVTRAALEQCVRYGVTTVLVLGGPGANDEQSAELQRLERNDEIFAPRIFATGNVITGPGSHPVTTIMRLPEDADAARLHAAGVTVVGPGDDPEPIVAKKAELGLDGVKIILERRPPPWHPNPRLPQETAEEVARHAKNRGLPVYVHAEAYEEFADAIELDADAVMHGVTDRLIDDPALIEEMKRKGVYYVPTLTLPYGFETLEKTERLDDELVQSGVSPRTLRGLENPLLRVGMGMAFRGVDLAAMLETGMKNLSRLHAAGVKAAVGTDASTPFVFPGHAVHIEMELMTRAGLSNAEALRAATVNAAAMLGIEEEAGVVAPGGVANLVLLGGNPLDDIRNTRLIERVVLKGRVLDPKLGAGE